jgi:hypothetical protein
MDNQILFVYRDEAVKVSKGPNGTSMHTYEFILSIIMNATNRPGPKNSHCLACMSHQDRQFSTKAVRFHYQVFLP